MQAETFLCSSVNSLLGYGGNLVIVWHCVSRSTAAVVSMSSSMAVVVVARAVARAMVYAANLMVVCVFGVLCFVF